MLAFDGLDQLGQLVAVERAEGQLGRRVVALRHLGQRRPKRVAAGQLVGLIGGQDAQAAGPRHPGQEGGQGPGPGVGRLQVLERDHHRGLLADPVEHPEDRLEHAGLTSLRLGHGRSLGQHPQAAEPLDDPGQEPAELLDPGPGDPRQLAVRQGGDETLEPGRHRRVGIADSARAGAAANDHKGLGQERDPSLGLVEKAAGAEPTAARDQES